MTGLCREHRLPWESVAEELITLGARTIYGLPDDSMGSASAFEHAGINLVVTAEQRTAVYAASGTAQMTGGFGVAVAGRGPATAALVPALLEASAQGAPIVVLVEIPNEEAVSDLSFQCVDPEPLLRPVCKEIISWNLGAVTLAKQRAEEAPSGPVVILVPEHKENGANEKDRAEAEPQKYVRSPTITSGKPNVPVFKRPILLVGSGCKRSDVDVVAIAEQLEAPIFVTASGRGCIDEDHPSFLGLGGLYTSPPIREIWQSTDGVVALGSELEETSLEFLPYRVPIHQVALRRSPADWPDRPVKRHLVDVSSWSPSGIAHAEPEWRQMWENARSQALVWAEQMITSGRVPAILDEISTLIRPGDSAVFENGASDIWSDIWPIFRLPRDVVALALSEQTTLGASIPAAAALARAHAENRTWSFSGDGAFIRSTLEPLVTEQERIIYIVFDDGGYGWLAEQARAAGLDPKRYASEYPRHWHDAWGRPIESVLVESAKDVERLAPHIEASSREQAVVLHIPIKSTDRSPIAQGDW